MATKSKQLYMHRWLLLVCHCHHIYTHTPFDLREHRYNTTMKSEMDTSNSKYSGKRPMLFGDDVILSAAAVNHLRAQSDTGFRLDDHLLFDPSGVLPPLPATATVPPFASDSPPFSDHSNSNAGGGGGFPPKPSFGHHLRSLSVDADFFGGLGLGGAAVNGGVYVKKEAEEMEVGCGEKRGKHMPGHSLSLDGSINPSSVFEADAASFTVKKPMAGDKLAELALIDPKRAKRMLANRQSAKRSKERKIRYTNDLERKMQMLQSEATTLSAQVTMLQRDTTGLTAENKELKLRLEAMEEQAKLRDALNDALKQEVQRLKIESHRIPSAVDRNPFNRDPLQFWDEQVPLPHFGGQQPQQQQQHQQLGMPQSSISSPTFSGQTSNSFYGYGQRI